MATGFHRRVDFDALTTRQREVLELIARGRTNGEIAVELGIGFESVKSHVSEILSRLGVGSREEAARAWSSRPRLPKFPSWVAVATGWKIAAVVAAVVVVTVAAVGFGLSKSGTVSNVEEPGTAPVFAGMQPGPLEAIAFGEGDIHEARLDLAKRLGLDAALVRLYSMEFRAWDGCGPPVIPRVPGTPPEYCLSTWFPGDVVTFEVAGLLYLYTVQSNPQSFIAVDWSDDVIIRAGDPGYTRSQQFDPSQDLARTLAYARGDVQVRTGAEDWTTTFVERVEFTDSCLGFEWGARRTCLPGAVPGFIIDYTSGAQRHRYHVAYGRVVAVDIEPGKAAIQPDTTSAPRLDAMRRHLAGRLSLPVEAIDVVDYREVVWGDACLAIYYAGIACPEGEVDGYFAAFRAGAREWHYHGRDAGFEPAAPAANESTRFGTWKRLR